MRPDELRHMIALAARSYNVPPQHAPSEEMWARIRLARDFNRLEDRVPRESVWEGFLLRRARSSALLLRGGARRVAVRVLGRNTNGSLTWLRRGGWMAAPAAVLMALALFSLSEIDSVLAPELAPTARAPFGAATQASYSGPDLTGAGTDGLLATAEWDEAALREGGTAATLGWLSVAVDDPVSEAYRKAATLHLRRSEVLISGFRAMDSEATIDRQMRSAARELLSSTRLLLDSPAAIKSQYRKVLEDLELVLIRISLITPSTARADRAHIERTLENKKLITRMRDLMPAPVSSNAN